MVAYLDNAATTYCYDSVVEDMVSAMKDSFAMYGNPSSMHEYGDIAKAATDRARNLICSVVRCKPTEIVFTSGGTEANNMAIFGIARANANRGKHIITSVIEHSSVINPMKQLEKEGFEVTYIGVDKWGVVNLKELVKAMRKDTILVSIMHVNNEIGTIQPIDEIGKIIKNSNPHTYFHCDMIQSFGKIPLTFKFMSGGDTSVIDYVDAFSVSGHKIHGPKGSGFLYIKEGTRINPFILGGGQELGMRSGTENVPGIIGLGTAVMNKYDYEVYDNYGTIMSLKYNFVERLTDDRDVYYNGGPSPYITSLTFVGVDADVMREALSRQGVYVSTGSACSSNGIRQPSRTLKAIGLSDESANSTIRFSFSDTTTMEEVDYAVKTIKKLLPTLRKLS